MFRLTLLGLIFTISSSFNYIEECKTNKHFSDFDGQEIAEFDQLSTELNQLKQSLPNKKYALGQSTKIDDTQKYDTVNRNRDINLVNKSIENVAWLKSTALRTQTEVSFPYRTSLIKLSSATRNLTNANTFTEVETNILEGIHNDIQAKCEAAQANFTTGFKNSIVTVRTSDRLNIERKGFLVCWAYYFDDRHQLNIKQCFAENSSTTTDSLFVPGEYVFWAEKLNKKGDSTIPAGPKKYVHVNSLFYKIDLFVQ